jgi:hypothetical protein
MTRVGTSVAFSIMKFVTDKRPRLKSHLEFMVRPHVGYGAEVVRLWIAAPPQTPLDACFAR